MPCDGRSTDWWSPATNQHNCNGCIGSAVSWPASSATCRSIAAASIIRSCTAGKLEGDFRKAAALAAEGIALLPDGGQAIRLYTNGLARALGKLGDVLGVERAIESAVALTSSVETPSGLTPAMSFDTYGDARWKANAATAYLSAGLYDKSLAYGRQVEVLVESSESAWSRALVRLDMATALVRRRPRDVERAVALGEEALEVSRARPIRSVWQRAHELGEAVTAVDRRRGRSYLEALREWPTGDTVAVTGGGSTTREI
ncbi:hypothetical protein [Nocardia farcinica]|uniref:hypothetical protein n=1 Tax=Nocardia farcinica TaxID=37329 RepID=UPI0024538FEF|nr:hypothetical protein [Nocardia farcinica]